MLHLTKLQKILLTIILILAVSIGFVVINHPIIKWDAEETIHLNYGTDEKAKTPKAVYEGKYIPLFAKDCEVKIKENNVDIKKLGTYHITYVATSGSHEETFQQEVIVDDTLAPVITLVENEDSYTLFEHPYEEEGYTAVDNYDGDITDQVASKEENGEVLYEVTDSHGNKAAATRKIVYDDRKGPAFSFADKEEVTVYLGEPFKNTFTAEDDLDGDLTDKVEVEGSVDTSTAGDYTLTYRVKDAHDNLTEVTRIVHVKKHPVNIDNGNIDSSKVIYLTFDDGPYQYTEKLLSILDQYNVKATFFTTSAYPSYAYCLAKEAAAGHTVAVHSATHNYAQIYANTDAYWADFNKQNEVVKAQTGSYSNIFRFPGGSSNTVSKSSCPGIMSVLAQQSADKGLAYFDWNVSSGDAGATTDTNVVYNNVVTQIAANTKYGKPSVVLQHDVKDYSVNAVGAIIEWGLNNGYTFRALSFDSYRAHHPIAN